MFQPQDFDPARPGLVRPVRVDPRGVAGPRRGEARSGAWRRTSHGFYVPTRATSVESEQRVLEASVLLPRAGAITGWAALRWRHASWFDGRRGDVDVPVPLATAGTSLRAQPSIRVCEEGLDQDEVEIVDGLRATTALRSTCFEMRYSRSDREAAQILSMAAYDDIVSVEEMALYAVAHAGWTGIPRCRWGVNHAVENAWSPTEVSMFLVWLLDAGRPRPLCNVPVFDRAGRFIGTPDLLDPHAGVLGEYDSGLHLAGDRRAIDIRREAAFRRVGLEPAVMLTADLSDPSQFVRRLDDAYRRARYRPEADRDWTIDPPSWWIPTLTVDQRRALTPAQRERLLAHRRVA